jgi:transposase
MAQNFIDSRRGQGFLLPPDVRDWLAGDHLAWFVIDAAAQLDLGAFYGAYRVDGHGAAAYEPSMMVTLLLYAYATEQRSSRMIERHCRQDVAYRVITGNVVPDHATVARFVVRHERALAEVFGQVGKLCDGAGLVSAGVIAIDGTRLAGNASKDRNREFGRIAREILAQAKATDEAEDQQHGEARGDELPEPLRTEEGAARSFVRPGNGSRRRPARVRAVSVRRWRTMLRRPGPQPTPLHRATVHRRTAHRRTAGRGTVRRRTARRGRTSRETVRHQTTRRRAASR